jgi:ribonuclease E
MITFTIEADTPEDFVRQARVLFPLAQITVQRPMADEPTLESGWRSIDPTATATEAMHAEAEALLADKPKRKRRTKAEIEADKAAEDEPAKEAATVETLPVSIEDIREVAKAIQAKLGEEALAVVSPIYESVGATHTSKVPADKYEEVHTKLVAALAEIEAAAPAGEVTVQEVRAAALAVLAKHGNDDGHARNIAVAKKLGHDKLTQLEPSQYAEAVALLKAEVED